jgi:proteic killer suppression protein
MIKSFSSKALAKLFMDADGRKVQPKHIKRLNQILTVLNIAAHPGHVDLPGLRFHALTGKAKGYFSVWMDENYRVVFTFKAGHVEEVDYVDYH